MQAPVRVDSSAELREEGSQRVISRPASGSSAGRERDLLEERDQLAAVIESSRDAVYTWDISGAIRRWNAAAAEMFGYAANEIIGRSILTLIPKERQATAQEVISRVREGAWYGQFETERVRKDGTVMQVELTVSPLSNASGEVTGASTVCREITERRRAEQLLTRRMKELAALYELTDRLQRANSVDEVCEAALTAILDGLDCRRASILLLDRSLKMRFAAWRGLSDRYREAVDGHSPWTPDVRDASAIWVDDIVATDEPQDLKDAVVAEGIRALAFIPLLAEGRLIGKFMVYHHEPRRYSPEEKHIATNIARQLSFSIERQRAEAARREAERRTRESEQRLEFALAAGRMGAWEWNIDSGKIIWSPGLEALHGREPGSFSGTFDEFSSEICEEDLTEVLARIGDVLKNGGDYHALYRTGGEARGARWLEAFGRLVRSEDGRPAILAGICMDVTERMRAQQHKDLLINELNHRVKNTLATVQAITHQTLRSHSVGRGVQRALEERLVALSSAHSLLTEQNWEGAELRQVVVNALRAHVDEARIDVAGPPVMLSPKSAVSIAMATHELATNAVKYGALSNESGRVAVTWNKTEASPAALRIEWRETDGPPVHAPQRRGFGSRLIEQNLAYDIDGRAHIAFDPGGLVCVIEAPIPSFGHLIGRSEP